MPLKTVWHLRLPQRAYGSTHATADGRILYLNNDHLNGWELHCLQSDKKQAWRRPVPLVGGDVAIGKLWVHGDSAYVAAQTLLRIEIASGRVLASRKVEHEYPRLRIWEGSFSLWQRGGSIAELSFDTLESLWERPDPDGTMTLHGGTLCQNTGDGDAAVVDPQTGVIRRWPLPALTPDILHQHLHDGHLYCRISGPERMAIDLRTGGVVWRHIEASPGPLANIWLQLRAGAIAYGVEPIMLAVDLSTGRVLWQRSPGGLNQTATFAYGRIYTGTATGDVVIVNMADGQLMASHPLGRHIHRVMPMGPAHVVVETETGNRNTSEVHVFEFREGD